MKTHVKVAVVVLATVAAICILDRSVVDVSLPVSIKLETGSIPRDCQIWYDGCNNCRVEDGKLTACTRRFCIRLDTPRCIKFGPNNNATKCVAQRELMLQLPTEAMRGGIIIPECNERGEYKTKQCTIGGDYCACVDPQGNVIPGTSSQNTYCPSKVPTWNVTTESGEPRWTVSTYATMQNVTVGDIVQFEWPESEVHNVHVFPTADAFKECDFMDAFTLADTTPGGKMFWQPTEEGSFYFGCSVDGHCSVGQKLEVLVTKGNATTVTNQEGEPWWSMNHSDIQLENPEVILFEWKVPQDVWWLPTKEAFDSCDFSAAVPLAEEADSKRFYWSPPQDGVYYLASRVDSNCERGSKLKIIVGDQGSKPTMSINNVTDVDVVRHCVGYPLNLSATMNMSCPDCIYRWDICPLGSDLARCASSNLPLALQNITTTNQSDLALDLPGVLGDFTRVDFMDMPFRIRAGIFTKEDNFVLEKIIQFHGDCLELDTRSFAFVLFNGRRGSVSHCVGMSPIEVSALRSSNGSVECDNCTYQWSICALDANMSCDTSMEIPKALAQFQTLTDSGLDDLELFTPGRNISESDLLNGTFMLKVNITSGNETHEGQVIVEFNDDCLSTTCKTANHTAVSDTWCNLNCFDAMGNLASFCDDDLEGAPLLCTCAAEEGPLLQVDGSKLPVVSHCINDQIVVEVLDLESGMEGGQFTWTMCLWNNGGCDMIMSISNSTDSSWNVTMDEIYSVFNTSMFNTSMMNMTNETQPEGLEMERNASMVNGFDANATDSEVDISALLNFPILINATIVSQNGTTFTLTKFVTISDSCMQLAGQPRLSINELDDAVVLHCLNFQDPFEISAGIVGDNCDNCTFTWSLCPLKQDFSECASNVVPKSLEGLLEAKNNFTVDSFNDTNTASLVDIPYRIKVAIKKGEDHFLAQQVVIFEDDCPENLDGDESATETETDEDEGEAERGSPMPEESPAPEGSPMPEAEAAY